MAMATVIDIVLVVAIVAFMVSGIKKGLIKSISKFLTWVLSFLIANSFTYFVAQYMGKLNFIVNFKGDLTEEFVCQSLGITEPLATNFTTHITQLVNAFFDNKVNIVDVQPSINYVIGEAICYTLSFLALFLVSLLVLKLLFKLLDLIFTKVVILKQLNYVLGGLMGIIFGFFWVSIMANLFVSVALPFLYEKLPEVFPMEIKDSVVISFCQKVNPLKFLMDAFNYISNLFIKK